MKTPEEFLTRGKGNFINCTDYDDAIQAMKDYAAQEVAKFISSKQDVSGMLPPTDEEVNAIRDEYSANWKKNNPEYPEADYLSGVNDGMYVLRNRMQEKSGMPVGGNLR